MIKYTLFLVGFVFLQSEIVWSDHLIENDRISGTPRLELNEENLNQLQLRTNLLGQSFLHKSQKSYILGDAAQFYTYNFENDKFTQENATLRYTDGLIKIWVADSEWSNGHVTDQVIQKVYEGLMLQTPSGSVDKNKGIIEIVHANFGLPPNFDGDGITDFLLTDIKDGWQDGEGFIAGYFNPLDQYINGTFIGRTQISGSNERDLLYIDTFPGIYHDGAYGYTEVLGTVSHEYQHLVNYRYDKNEATFVNEGLSELSSFLCGYGLRDPSKYLIDTNISITGWDTDLPQALAHYAKTALWTYYLYEKLGVTFIQELTRSGLNGIPGIESALNAVGSEETFNELMRNFFITIALNTTVNGLDFQFEWEALKGVRAAPQNYIFDYPHASSIKNPVNALGIYRFENGDTLSVTTGNLPSHVSLLINKFAINGLPELLVPFPPYGYQDDDFGTQWQTEDVMVINYETNAVWSLSASASQIAYISDYLLSEQSLDLRIQISQDIVANSIMVPYDSCWLQSVRFYNQQSSAGVNVHIYSDKIADGMKPAGQSVLFDNILQGDWVELDLRSVEIWRQAGETFDIGIEFIDGGIIGYTVSDIEGVNSFLYRAADGKYSALDNFKVDGVTLTGSWLLDIRYAAPLAYKPGNTNQIPASFTIESIGPVPFPSPTNPVLRIQYTVNKPGNLTVDVYNILGQRVRRLFEGYEDNLAGTLTWFGDNALGAPVASGTYILHFRFEDQAEARKILIIR